MRTYYGDSQEDFAHRIGKSTGTVGNWERGNATPDVGTLLHVAQTLGISARWLQYGEGDMFDIESRGYLSGKTPTSEQSNASLVGEMGTDYSGHSTRRVLSITIDPEDDVKQIGRWVISMLEDAAEVVVQGADVTKAKEATTEGQRYRWRLVFEPIDPKQSPQQPSGPAQG